MSRQLEWFRYFVHPGTVIGSFFTLIGTPFMLAFLCLVIIGAVPVGQVNVTVLSLMVLAVGVMLYGEHMLDDSTISGKPWNTVLSDRVLLSMAALLFLIGLCIGVYLECITGSDLPAAFIFMGIIYCIVYGLDLYHTVSFGAMGMGLIPAASYVAQVVSTDAVFHVLPIACLFIFGYTYGYVMLALYQHSKTENYKIAWRLLGVHFIMIYALAVGLCFKYN
jgi:hypothetical protein